MKKTIGIFAIATLLLSCNINPNKEARIQKLEMELEQSSEKIAELESRVKNLEITLEELQEQRDSLTY